MQKEVSSTPSLKNIEKCVAIFVLVLRGSLIRVYWQLCPNLANFQSICDNMNRMNQEILSLVL